MARSNFVLTPELKADARAALTLLDGTGISLQEAARRALTTRRGARRITMAEAIDEFVRSRLKAGLRRATVDWYEERLTGLNRTMGMRIMDTITRPELVEEVERLHPTPSAGSATIRACRVLWRWGERLERPIVGQDITTGLVANVASRGGRAPTVLPVPQCLTMLEGAGHHRSALALMLLAGIRPHEVCGPQKPWLLWRHINLEEKLIRIPAEIAKTGRKRGSARLLEGLPDALWHWLEPRGDEHPVAFAEARQVVRTCAGLAGYGHARFGGGEAWPQDALRHTFASYALALTSDPGKVSLWLGHEGKPRTLYNHYRGMATLAHATAFFALRPPVKS
jgi:integrase